MPYGLLADAVLIVHFGIVVFIVGGLAVIVLGNRVGWRWVNDRRFRIAHVAAIGFVVVQAWLGRICPLTTLESWLRAKAGEAGYDTSFVEHWVERLIFYDAPLWTFAAAYTLFALLVAAAWWRYPPERRARGT
ncbi:MAG TPA: DUF2784 domain-containing protein [Gammaproteobacteria bacterium]